MYNQAAQAYQRTTQATVDPRELEATLLLKAASKLQIVQDDWNNRSGDLKPALAYNRKLWVILATSATRDESPLPQEIKNNIGSLAVFIFRHMAELEEAPIPTRLSSLIGINRAIAAGLRRT